MPFSPSHGNHNCVFVGNLLLWSISRSGQQDRNSLFNESFHLFFWHSRILEMLKKMQANIKYVSSGEGLRDHYLMSRWKCRSSRSVDIQYRAELKDLCGFWRISLIFLQRIYCTPVKVDYRIRVIRVIGLQIWHFWTWPRGKCWRSDIYWLLFIIVL